VEWAHFHAKLDADSSAPAVAPSSHSFKDLFQSRRLMLTTVAATLVAVPGIAVMIHKTVDHGHDEHLAVNFDQFLTGLASPSVFIELIWPLRHSDSSGEEVSIRLRLCLQGTKYWLLPDRNLTCVTITAPVIRLMARQVAISFLAVVIFGRSGRPNRMQFRSCTSAHRPKRFHLVDSRPIFRPTPCLDLRVNQLTSRSAASKRFVWLRNENWLY
jgi:hypothetical protein